jgi:hypothetical protein
MPLSIREEVMASLLAREEATGWAGEIDKSAHVNSFTGVHNWRTDDEVPSDDALLEVLQREFEQYLRRSPTPSSLVVALIDVFEDGPTLDGLVDLVTTMRSQGRLDRPPA